MAKKKREFKLWKEFKAFISRGNVLDMAVGVVIGSAFSAIVTSIVNILLSLCTWAVPGGLKGLVSVLPAVFNKAQAGIDGIGQQFTADQLDQMTIDFAAGKGVTITEQSDTFLQWQNALLSKYTLHGGKYIYNMAAIIDWGTLINAVISFLIVALTLFIVVKIVNTLKAKKAELDAKMLEAYYVKHPEERPVPVEPGKPAPTEVELLIQIRDALAEKK